MTMLSTSNLSAAQAENYFVKDDYYTEEEQHEASFWLGKGANNLGLTGTVEKAVFGELLSGIGPGGEVLSGKAIDPTKRRAATDFTFSAPKSVSVAALVQQDARVLAAHHQAVGKGAVCHGGAVCADADFDGYRAATTYNRECDRGGVSPCDESGGGTAVA